MNWEATSSILRSSVVTDAMASASWPRSLI
jgi:hypothetical protein